ncbi:MAG TPA: hypothetical protein VM409_03120 [Chloroflexia bacterium]|nr:hypothetical protein [Chloroflexia bacterium]
MQGRLASEALPRKETGRGANDEEDPARTLRETPVRPDVHIVGPVLVPTPQKTNSTGDSTEQAATRIGLRVHLGVLAAFSVLTFLLTLPIGLTLDTRIPGGGDAWQNIWNLWWAKQSILNLHTNPYHTDLLFYPQGVNLYLHTLVLTAGIIGIPLQLIGLNLVATYNVIALLTFVLAGYGMFLLCHYLTRSNWASFVGGFVFAFAPYHTAHLYGHLNLLCLQWIPFYVVVLLKAIDAPGPQRFLSEADTSLPRTARLRALGWAAGAGALLAVNAYTDWLYAVFVALLTAFILGWKVMFPHQRAEASARGLTWGEAALRSLVMLAALLLFTAPILLPTFNETLKGYAQQPDLETLVYSSDAVLAFIPSELHPLWGGAVKRFANATGPYLPMKNPSERVVFVGYSVLALAGVALYRLRANRKVRFWAFAAFATWLLSLGPVLQLFGKTSFTIFQVTVPLPYLLLYKLPLVSIMRTPARLIVLTMLALGILSAFAVMSLLRRRDADLRANLRSPGAVAAFILPVLIGFEFLIAPFPQSDIVPPGWGVPIYSRIAAEPGNFALLELPLRPFSDYMAYQTIHGKPIIGGYVSRQPPYALESTEPVVRYLLDSTPVTDPARAEIQSGRGVEALRKLNVKYVIIRWWAFTEENKAAMQEKLNVLFGGRKPDFSYAVDQVDAWQLSP